MEYFSTAANVLRRMSIFHMLIEFIRSRFIGIAEDFPAGLTSGRISRTLFNTTLGIVSAATMTIELILRRVVVSLFESLATTMAGCCFCLHH
jgi:hypothetical protein